MLKPQDALVACKLLVVGPEWTYDRLSAALALSRAEAHACVRRLDEAGALRAPAGGGARLRRREILEVLLAVPRIFCGRLDGRSGRGVLTSTRAPVISGLFEIDSSGEPVVWDSPYPETAGELGLCPGRLLRPLYPTAPRAVRGDQDLWRLLALLDVLRVGEPGEKKRAASLLRDCVLGER
jgi:hypothetical protein